MNDIEYDNMLLLQRCKELEAMRDGMPSQLKASFWNGVGAGVTGGLAVAIFVTLAGVFLRGFFA